MNPEQVTITIVSTPTEQKEARLKRPIQDCIVKSPTNMSFLMKKLLLLMAKLR